MELAAARNQPVVGLEVPDLWVEVGPDALRHGVQAVVDRALAGGRLGASGGGLGLSAQPSLRIDRLGLQTVADCAQCVRASLDWSGTLHVAMGFVGQPTEVDVPMSGRTELTLAVLVDQAAGERALRVEPRQVGAFEVDLDLDLVPLLGDALLGEAIEQVVESQLRDLPIEQTVVARFGEAASVRPRQVQVALDPGPGAVGLRLGVRLDGVPLGTRPPARGSVHGDGFRVHLPVRTLLGLARAVSAAAPPTEAYLAEPTGLVLQEDRFALDLRVWHVRGALTARDVRVHGRVQVGGAAGLRVVPDRAEAGPATRVGVDPLGLLVRAGVLQQVRALVGAALPQVVEEDGLEVRLTGVRAAPDGLSVRGRVAPAGG